VTALRRTLFASLPLVAAVLGCSEDHGLLAPTTSSAGPGGGGATSGSGGKSTGSGGTGGTGGGTTSTTTTGLGGAEPDGPTRLTIVNAIADYSAIRVCFQPFPSGAPVTPWPASPGGLAFSGPMVVDPATISPSGGDVQPVVLAGDLPAIVGKSCDDAIALAAGGANGSGSGSGGSGGGMGAGGAGGGSGVRAASMPVIPGSVFASKKSLLLVFFGCIGGPGHDDGTNQLGCGSTYTPATPTANLTLVAMSRKTISTSIALQFVDASAAMPTSDIRITPGIDSTQDVPVVSSIALGGLAPKPPFIGIPRTGFGLLSKVSIRTFAPNDTYPTSALFLTEAFDHGGIKDTDFVDGSGFTIVALGGYPGVNAQSYWHGFTYTMVKSAP
jgi:hypothetical protein